MAVSVSPIRQLVRAFSNSVKVLNSFQTVLRNFIHCVHNCEDHSSFDFISALLI